MRTLPKWQFLILSRAAVVGYRSKVIENENTCGAELKSNLSASSVFAI
jgi:hypothetical protein